jgi:DNA-binding transcriptional MocR family regulator
MVRRPERLMVRPVSDWLEPPEDLAHVGPGNKSACRDRLDRLDTGGMGEAGRDSEPALRSLDATTVLGQVGGWSHGSGPLYSRLAAALRRAVERGDIPAGTRLPPERLLATRLSVSRGTVMAAYRELRRRGVATSRQGSGTWIRVDSARPIELLTDAVAVRARQLTGALHDATPDVVDLSISGSSTVTDMPRDLFAAAERSWQHTTTGHGYEPLGLLALRERIAAYYDSRSIPTAVDQVVVTSGAQQAITAAAALLVRPGDAVVVESPTYAGAIDAFARAGARLVCVPPSSQWPNIGPLRRAVEDNAPRLVYLMPPCHNPIGHAMPDGLRREVAALADSHETYVISDDILADLVVDPPTAGSITGYSRSGRVLNLGSLGKVLWGGLRIGWLRGPATFVDRLGRWKSAADLGSSVLSQVVACGAMDDYDALAARRRVTLAASSRLMQAELRRRLPEWTWTAPEGGPTLWVRLPGVDADAYAEIANRHGVRVTPGSVFCADGASPDRLRLTFARPDDVICEGVRRLAEAWAAMGAGGAVPSVPATRPATTGTGTRAQAV